MPKTNCCVPYCSTRGGHKFPKDDHLKNRWIIAVRRQNWKPNEHSLVCRLHFTEEDFYGGCGKSLSLKPKRERGVRDIEKEDRKRERERERVVRESERERQTDRI